MLAETLMALAALAGNAVVAAATTDAWEAARRKGSGGCWGAATRTMSNWLRSGWRKHASSSRGGGRGSEHRGGRGGAMGGAAGGPAGGSPGRGG